MHEHLGGGGLNAAAFSAASSASDSAGHAVGGRDLWVYVREAIEAGRKDAAEVRLVDLAEVKRRFGLPE
jgi:hypothetical protein